jgi:hypothetical protein
MVRTKKVREVGPTTTGAMLGMYWCGSIRCYVVGNEVAFCEASDSVSNPKLMVRSFVIEHEEEDGIAYVRAALHELMAEPEGFPLHGMHWRPQSLGGTGPVIEDEPRHDGWKELALRDVKHVSKLLGWSVD